MTAHTCLTKTSLKLVCLLQLEAALVKAQTQVKHNEEQCSNLQQKLQSSVTGRQETVSHSMTPFIISCIRSGHLQCFLIAMLSAKTVD